MELGRLIGFFTLTWFLISSQECILTGLWTDPGASLAIMTQYPNNTVNLVLYRKDSSDSDQFALYNYTALYDPVTGFLDFQDGTIVIKINDDCKSSVLKTSPAPSFQRVPDPRPASDCGGVYSATSVHSSTPIDQSILINGSRGIAFANNINPDDYVQIALAFRSQVISLLFQGRANIDQWVTMLNLLWSENGSDWNQMVNITGVNDRNTIQEIYFSQNETVWVQYIRVNPMWFNVHKTMRLCVRQVISIADLPPDVPLSEVTTVDENNQTIPMIGSITFHCPQTVISGFCILPLPDAISFIGTNGGYVSWMNTTTWGNTFFGYVMVTKGNLIRAALDTVTFMIEKTPISMVGRWRNSNQLLYCYENFICYQMGTSIKTLNWTCNQTASMCTVTDVFEDYVIFNNQLFGSNGQSFMTRDPIFISSNVGEEFDKTSRDFIGDVILQTQWTGNTEAERDQFCAHLCTTHISCSFWERSLTTQDCWLEKNFRSFGQCDNCRGNFVALPDQYKSYVIPLVNKSGLPFSCPQTIIGGICAVSCEQAQSLLFIFPNSALTYSELDPSLCFLVNPPFFDLPGFTTRAYSPPQDCNLSQLIWTDDVNPYQFEHFANHTLRIRAINRQMSTWMGVYNPENGMLKITDLGDFLVTGERCEVMYSGSGLAFRGFLPAKNPSSKFPSDAIRLENVMGQPVPCTANCTLPFSDCYTYTQNNPGTACAVLQDPTDLPGLAFLVSRQLSSTTASQIYIPPVSGGISIQHASWNCNPSSFIDANLLDLQKQCNGKSSCNYIPSNVDLSDPCVGFAYKWLNGSYTCSNIDGIFNFSVFEQGGQLQIRCDDHICKGMEPSEAPSRGSIGNCTALRFNESCFTPCNPGLVSYGPQTRTCQKNGTLTPLLTNCGPPLGFAVTTNPPECLVEKLQNFSIIGQLTTAFDNWTNFPSKDIQIYVDNQPYPCSNSYFWDKSAFYYCQTFMSFREQKEPYRVQVVYNGSGLFYPSDNISCFSVCPINSYLARGDLGCQSCGQNAASPRGTMSIDDCRCNEGFSGKGIPCLPPSVKPFEYHVSLTLSVCLHDDEKQNLINSLQFPKGITAIVKSQQRVDGLWIHTVIAVIDPLKCNVTDLQDLHRKLIDDPTSDIYKFRQSSFKGQIEISAAPITEAGQNIWETHPYVIYVIGGFGLFFFGLFIAAKCLSYGNSRYERVRDFKKCFINFKTPFSWVYQLLALGWTIVTLYSTLQQSRPCSQDSMFSTGLIVALAFFGILRCCGVVFGVFYWRYRKKGDWKGYKLLGLLMSSLVSWDLLLQENELAIVDKLQSGFAFYEIFCSLIGSALSTFCGFIGFITLYFLQANSSEGVDRSPTSYYLNIAQTIWSFGHFLWEFRYLPKNHKATADRQRAGEGGSNEIEPFDRDQHSRCPSCNRASLVASQFSSDPINVVADRSPSIADQSLDVFVVHSDLN